MDFASTYYYLKIIHVVVVTASVGLFILRGLSVICGYLWQCRHRVKVIRDTIDGIVLFSALVLVSLLPVGAFKNGWILCKILLLVGYFISAYLVFKDEMSLRGRIVSFCIALIFISLVLFTALTHQSLLDNLHVVSSIITDQFESLFV